MRKVKADYGLTNALSAVSFKSSYAAADVGSFSVGTQSVGLTFVWCITLALIDVWIVNDYEDDNDSNDNDFNGGYDRKYVLQNSLVKSLRLRIWDNANLKAHAAFFKNNVHLPIAMVSEEVNGTKVPISCPFHFSQVISDLKQRERRRSRQQN